MEDSGDERDSNAPASDVESGSDPESVGRDLASAWARKFIDSSIAENLPSTFDAYFTQSTQSSKTSSSVFSELVAPLTPQEFRERIRGMKSTPGLDERTAKLEKSHISYFPAYITELAAGFNLLFYGFGSKRKLLNRLARLCAKKGHVVIGNGFFPNFTLRDLLASAEQVIGAPDGPNAGSGPEAQCRRILAKYAQKPTARHLFLIIHNIDGYHLRSERAKSCLAFLAAHPSIHIAASVDHIMAPLLWSTTETFGQPLSTTPPSSNSSAQSLTSGGFSWLWHDLTTIQPYDFELAYADRTSYAGASAGQRTRGQADIAGIGSAGGTIAEGAALHVLASVTAKAKRLFALLCTRQRAAIDALAAETGATVASSAHVATSYELLFAAARDEFIATNDTAMRALLGEFRDHGLVVSANAADGSEALWIPLPKDALVRLASEIN